MYMSLNRYHKTLPLALIFLCWVPGANADQAHSGDPDTLRGFASRQESPPKFILVQSDEKEDKETKPKSGTVVYPSDYDNKESSKEKKCMTVCSRWGETCVYDIQRGKKCRRTCKEFTEECF